MERKINNFIKKIEISKNCLDKLNLLIEEKCLNSKVLLVVDFFAYKNYKDKLEEIKSCSLNFIEIIVISKYDEINYKKIEKFIDESCDIIVGIGEFNTLKFVEELAIKNNISYAFANLCLLKSEIFYKNLCEINNFNQYFPPYFILIEQLNLNKLEVFELYCNIFKYSFLYLENVCNNFIDKNINNFLNDYGKILNNLNEKNVYYNIIALGLLLNKYKIKFFMYNTKFKSEFYYLICIYCLNACYKNIFDKVNKNNLYFSRNYINNVHKINEFENFDFEFNKFYLLAKKDSILNATNNFTRLLLTFFETLKTLSINCCYKLFYSLNSNNILQKFNESINNDLEVLFLQKMQNFEIFKLSL